MYVYRLQINWGILKKKFLLPKSPGGTAETLQTDSHTAVTESKMQNCIQHTALKWWVAHRCSIPQWTVSRINSFITILSHSTGSLWRRQSQQSFNTLTPFNFLFYSHVSAYTGHEEETNNNRRKTKKPPLPTARSPRRWWISRPQNLEDHHEDILIF
jgi:hypothetical protein